jgi:hypothetical protein
MVQKETQMVKKRRKTGNILLLFLAVLLPGLGTYALAQKPMVSLTVSDKKVTPNETVTFIVTTNLNGPVKVDYPVEFAADYGLMHGMEQKMDPATGKIKTYYYVQQTGSFRKAGTYTLIAHVKYQNVEYKSNKITVTVTDSGEDEEENLGYNSKEPIFGVIQARKTTVYEGEPVLLKARVFSRYDIYFLEAYKPFKADKNAEEHVFQNQRQRVEETKYNGRTMMTFDYGKQLLFPITTGKCRIQPFEMALRCHTAFFDKTVTFRSSSTVINVKPLPDGAPATFIGGVGEYGLSQMLGKTKIKQGEVFTLTLVVQGLGNLHNINPPVLDLPKGCSVYGDPERKENFHFNEEGVEGEIAFVYNIRVTNSGKVKFEGQEIAYFDPNKEEYITVSADPFELDVERDASFHPIADHTQPASGPQDVGIRPLKKHAPKKNGSNQTALVVSIAAPVCLLGLLLFLFIGKRKRKEELLNENAETQKPLFDAAPAETRDYWALAEQSLEDKNNFAILLPKAIVQRLEQSLRSGYMTREKVFSAIADKDPETAEKLREIIETCDQFRYGFGDPEMDTHHLLERADQLLRTI